VRNANFGELRTGEVRRTSLPRTQVNNPLEYVPRLRAGKIKLITHRRKEGLTGSS
jgi:hypothetical protein